ncbi:glycosyltransferase [Fictibacillus sp. UD]|uniref:glycosyltransferase n=1 Tax=Fictibacillus sp. UD TaxID=3038777 RepID=UPI0037470DBE
MLISLCLITKNEEATIERCIESIKEIVDETVVIDTGSNDSTIEIVKNIGVKTYSFEWMDDFSAARNYAISKTNGDWIIFLDGDEYIDKNQASLIKTYIQEANNKGMNTLLTGLININASSGNFQSSTKTIRIFKNEKSIKYRGKIHETLYSSKGPLKYLDVADSISIFHTGYTPEVIKSKNKSERNLKILFQELGSDPKNGDLNFYIAESLMIDRQYDKAILHLEKAIQLKNGIINGLLYRCFSNILTCMYEQKRDITHFYEVYNRAIKLDEDYPDFYFFLGLRELELKEYSKAMKLFYKCLDKINLYNYNFESRVLTEVFNIYRTIINLQIANKNYDEVIKLAVNILKVDKYDYNTLYILTNILLKNEQVENVFEFLLKLYEKDLLKDKLYLLKVSESINNELLSGMIVNLLEVEERKEFFKNNPQKKIKYMMKNIKSFNQGEIKKVNPNEEFETYKKQIKQTITSFIDNNQINEANKLILEYENIVINDIEVYSFKAIIYIIENNFKEAEVILKKGLELDNNNFDLLFNSAYLYETTNEQEIAAEYYMRALQIVEDNDTKELIINSLKGLGIENPVATIKPKTSIVILTYNNLEYNKLCIESIRKYTLQNTYEIIVIDNNSTDGTVEWLKEQKDLVTIYNKENVGFPVGCNQGIKIANQDNDILLLNNDVVVTPNWLDNLKIGLYSESIIGAVGAVTNNCSNNQVINANYNNLDQLIEFSRENNISDKFSWIEKLRLVGFCMLIKREVIDKVGLLDEIFTPGNFEDDDYSYRIRQIGYKLLLCKDSFIHHFGSTSFKKSPVEYNKILHDNREKFKKKWGFDPNSINHKELSMFNNLNDVMENNQDNVIFTGERLVINNEVKEKHNNVFEEHIERYRLASKFVGNLKVLDAACGAGYGTKMLELAGAEEVTGIDISEDSLNNARETYYGDNITFEYGDVNQLPFPNKSYDVVVSFETIEHIDKGLTWIEESSRVLNDGGIFIVSTPNRDVTNPGSYHEEQPLNSFHKFEYNTQEFIGELLKKYDIIELYGQTFVNDKDIPYTNIMRQLRKKDVNYIPKNSKKIVGHKLISLGEIKDSLPTYLVAVCKKKCITN